MRTVAIAVLVLAFFLAPSKAAAAAEQFWHVGLDLGAKYDNNVFVIDKDESSDVVYEYRPWVELKTPIGRISVLDLKYTLSGKMYSDFSDSNSVEHDFNATLKIRGNTYYGKVSESFTYSSYPIASDVAGKTDNWNNNLSASLGAAYNKFGWEFGVGLAFQGFPDLKIFDYTDISVFGEGNYRISDKTQVFARLSYGTVNYKEDTHNEPDYYDVKIGLRGTLTDRLTYDIGAGYQTRDYDDKGTLADSSDYESFSFDGSLKYLVSEKSSAAFTVSYKPTESTLSNYNETLFFGLSAKHGFTTKISTTAMLSLDIGKNSLDSDNDYTKWTFSSSASYAIKDWVGLKFEFSYEYRNTDAFTGEYDRMTAGLFLSMRY